ncbi:hypothetical protein UFOVP142_22 [uncultured Caudovirales phage]|uniref:Uncharacterized protein n=1 Tax=uncultured Caudovirales phage TaxID=2100421 RepID=A0A6J7XMG4_9CAUD|nr:hypothetical protein UFOVP142_22 [uncultured Caudovirales phage]
MSVINYLKGLMGFDQATKEKLRIRQEALARWTEDEKLWVKYYMAQIPCTKPDLNKYLADPKYRWTPPSKPLPPGPRPI